MQSNASTAELTPRLSRLSAAVLGSGRRTASVSADDHQALRFVGATQFIACTAVLLMLLVLPDTDASDHTNYAILAAVGVLAALVRWNTRRSSLEVVRVTNVGALLYVATIVAVSRPLGATAFLMLWPLLSTASCLGRRDLAAALLAMSGLLYVAVAANGTVSGDAWLDTAPVVAVITFASVLVSLLRERLDQLIGDLERTASTDGLTGLANRTSWNASFDTEIERARRSGAPLSIAVFDLDRFKAINDCLGHAEGDRALVRFSNLLATECRSFDVAGRLGGEEFGLLLVGANAEGAHAFAERLRGRLELVTRHDETPFTVSTGVAELSVHADDPEGMMLAADRALYRAKAEGRDRVIIADLPPLARAEASEGEPGEVDALDALGQSAEQLSLSVTLKLEPQPQAATTFGFSTLNPAPVNASTKSITDPST